MPDSIAFAGTEYRVMFPSLLRDLTPEEDADLGEAIKRAGRVLKPIVTDGNGGLIDGLNRLRWAQKLGFDKHQVPVSGDGRGKSADQQQQMALDLNDTGRQDTFFVRQANRIARVAEARGNGESLRSIAEKEGVSEKTVRDDLARCVPPYAPGPADGKTKGRDGKSYPVKTVSVLCDRCARGAAVRDCPRCAEVREQAAKAARKKRKAATRNKRDQARGEMKDATGKDLPPSCRDAFADTQLHEMIAQLQAIHSQFHPEPWVAKAGKLCEHYGFILIEKFHGHIYDALARLELATEALAAGIPYAVCPKCEGVDSKKDGKCCKGCRGCGHVPEGRYKELVGA